MTIKELRDKRLNIHEQMKAIIKKADDESRQMTAEESEVWNRMNADLDALRSDIDRREAVEKEERALAEPIHIPAGKKHEQSDPNDPLAGETTEERKRKEEAIYRQWMRGGLESLSNEQRAVMNRRRASDHEARYTPQTETTSGGGYLIPEGFSNRLEVSLKAYGGVRSVADVMSTPSGNTIPYPTVDDTSNVGELVAINTPATGQAVTYGNVNLNAYKFSSKAVLVPIELLQDSYFNIDTHLLNLLTVRVGRATNTYFTTGTGTDQPEGVVTAATLGKTGSVGSDDNIPFADLVDLVHSVDPAYRTNARFMFNDLSLAAIKKLVDDQGRPLFLPAISGGTPDTVLGYPYVINQDMDDMASGNKSILFGDFSKFIVRDVMPFSLVRIAEKYIESGQIAFLAWSRHDSRCINTSAIKYYANGAAS